MQYIGMRQIINYDYQISNIIPAPGTLVIFPSYILHRVAPIKKGERISLVGWVGGDHYK